MGRKRSLLTHHNKTDRSSSRSTNCTTSWRQIGSPLSGCAENSTVLTALTHHATARSDSHPPTLPPTCHLFTAFKSQCTQSWVAFCTAWTTTSVAPVAMTTF
eukprot:12927024-Prorocentrum_lima.AAC.1